MGLQGIYIIVAAILSVVASLYGADYLAQSDNAMNALINVFAILGGVLVAVISIVGDPSMLLPGNWRVGHEHAKDMQDRIASFSHLFFVYIVSLLFLVLAMIVKDAKIEDADFVFVAVAFFSSFGILLSVPLPYSLMAIQKERMREEVKSRKARNGELANDPGSK